MPIMRNITLNLDKKQVLRRSGLCYSSKLQLQVMSILQELLVMLGDLLAPAIVYELHLISFVSDDLVCLDNGIVFHGSSLSQFLVRAREIAVVVCTIGPTLEKKVNDYFTHNEPLRGLILDHIGTAALDSLAAKACEFINREASFQGYKSGAPFSPGQLDSPILDQWHLFELVPAEQIGVQLTSMGMMVPRKSISMVIGMGSKMTTRTRADICNRCSLKETCLYRIQA